MSASIIPPARPKISRAEVEKILDFLKVDRQKYPVIIFGIPAYYLNSMGAEGKNDRGVYDDAGGIITPDVFAAFNWNCDPSSYREGYGLGAEKGMATLIPNKVYYAWKYDLHKGKTPALCQRVGPMDVMRDGKNGPYMQSNAWIGCNNHPGGINTTGSLCCQTVPPEQWNEYFNKLVVPQLQKFYGDEWRNAVVPYAIIDEYKRRTL